MKHAISEETTEPKFEPISVDREGKPFKTNEAFLESLVADPEPPFTLLRANIDGVWSFHGWLEQVRPSIVARHGLMQTRVLTRSCLTLDRMADYQDKPSLHHAIDEDAWRYLQDEHGDITGVQVHKPHQFFDYFLDKSNTGPRSGVAVLYVAQLQAAEAQESN